MIRDEDFQFDKIEVIQKSPLDDLFLNPQGSRAVYGNPEQVAEFFEAVKHSQKNQ